eukprot:COSAG04_NODE_3920_length_2421_cov_2.208010_2_plen_73_part_00
MIIEGVAPAIIQYSETRATRRSAFERRRRRPGVARVCPQINLELSGEEYSYGFTLTFQEYRYLPVLTVATWG